MFIFPGVFIFKKRLGHVFVETPVLFCDVFELPMAITRNSPCVGRYCNVIRQALAGVQLRNEEITLRSLTSLQLTKS